MTNQPMRRSDIDTDFSDGTVYIALEIENGEIAHMELIDCPPNPESVRDGSWGNARFFIANINGGDYEEYIP